MPVQWINADLIEHAQQKRQGLLFLTPHLGCFEMTAQAVQQRFGAQIGQLTVLYRPSRQPTLTPLMAQARQRQGLALAPTNLSGVRILLKALRLGQAVGLLPDQVPPEGMGQWTPFFGHNAYTMTLAARLALQTGATIILVWCERLTWGRGYVMRVASLNAPLSGDLGVAVLQINQAMEQLIRQAPQQYLWGYGRYKQPRREL